jgi:Lamin Tail Domain
MHKLIALPVLLITTATLISRCVARNLSPARVVSAVRLSIEDRRIEIGQTVIATATAFDQTGEAIRTAPVTYTSTTPRIAIVNARTGAILGISPGTARIIATVEGKSDRQRVTVVRAPIRINEIVPDGDGSRGWVELFNPTTAQVDVSGWTVTASDPYQGVLLPEGSIIAPGGFLVIDEMAFPLGLKGDDAVHLFSRFLVQVDSYAWSAEPAGAVERCPDGSGPFVAATVSTRASANACTQDVSHRQSRRESETSMSANESDRR